jgi:hypothetical protein
MYVFLHNSLYIPQSLIKITPDVSLLVNRFVNIGLSENFVFIRMRGWLKHCATSRKVAGSIADGVIGICH